MSSEIIQSAAYNNYDDFQHDFHYFEDYFNDETNWA
jgi:hypothetical protein